MSSSCLGHLILIDGHILPGFNRLILFVDDNYCYDRHNRENFDKHPDRQRGEDRITVVVLGIIEQLADSRLNDLCEYDAQSDTDPNETIRNDSSALTP